MIKRLLLTFGLLLATMLPSRAQKTLPPNDPGSNNPPFPGAILDLSGTPIPAGGDGTYQQYTVNFTAAFANTAITFAFRDDPAFLFFYSPSVSDLTTPGAIC
jgi:hypothetical protein